MSTNHLLKKHKNKILSPGGEIYLNHFDSLDFIDQCGELKIPIYGIDIVKKTKFATISPLDKTIVYHDQIGVYASARKFIKDQMNTKWNYAIFIVERTI